MMVKGGLIRTVYLYIFTIVGLALLVSGAVRFLDMGLKMFVFTEADLPEKYQQSYYYPSFTGAVEKLEIAQTSEEFTEEEIASIKSWLADYDAWKENTSKIDYVRSRRQSEASTNLAMILVGLPLYLYHWITIKRELKEA